MLLASGRFAVSQTIIPEAQEHFLTPSAHRDTHIFGGLGLRRLISVPLLDREILPADEADPFEARSGLIVFPDRISVASAREVVRIVRQDIGQNHISIFDLSRTEYVDDTAAMIIGQLIDVATDLGTRRFIIAGLQPEVTETLKSMKILDSIPASNFVANLDEAKLVARPMLASFAPVSSE